MNKARLVSLGTVHTSRLLEKSNNKINRIDLDNKITIEPKNEKI